MKCLLFKLSEIFEHRMLSISQSGELEITQCGMKMSMHRISGRPSSGDGNALKKSSIAPWPIGRYYVPTSTRIKDGILGMAKR